MATTSDDHKRRPPGPGSRTKGSKGKLKDAIVRGQSASAAVRRHADIQKGKTGDKVPGFDPAAAPMETDAEAGGAPTLAYPSAQAIPETEPATDAHASNHGDALRPFIVQSDDDGARRLQFMLFAVAAIVFLLGVSMFLLLGL